MKLLRLAEARYVGGTIVAAFALAPLVQVTFCGLPKFERGPRFGQCFASHRPNAHARDSEHADGLARGRDH